VQEAVIGAGTVLGVHANGLRAARLGGADGRHHLRDDRRPVEPAAELAGDHLVRGGDRQVVVAQPQRQRTLNVSGHRPAPAGQPHRTERPGLGEGNVGPDVRHLMEEEREASLGLCHTQLGEVEVDHRLAELRQPRARGLHPVAVGHVEEVNDRHVIPP
jgi:hypothetical protein